MDPKCPEDLLDKKPPKKAAPVEVASTSTDLVQFAKDNIWWILVFLLFVIFTAWLVRRVLKKKADQMEPTEAERASLEQI